MRAFALAVLAAAGVGLLLDHRGRVLPIASRTGTELDRARHRARQLGTDIAARLGIEDVDPREFTAIVVVLALLGGALGWAVFAGILPALAIAGFGASFPIASARVRAQARRTRALEAWPRLIEELRILTGSLGRSIPQALFEVGGRGPDELRPAFDIAQREWLLSTDFAKTIGVLKARLGDATTDAVCETLLVAHELGGTEIDRRLEALADDRRLDCQGRKDARSRQAGARFARRFVLFVPLGMAMAGMSVGDGRAAYGTATGQALVLVGIAVVVVCWLWASRIMRLPSEDRVFDR
jgi:tight adherence protein B